MVKKSEKAGSKTAGTGAAAPKATAKKSSAKKAPAKALKSAKVKSVAAKKSTKSSATKAKVPAKKEKIVAAKPSAAKKTAAKKTAAKETAGKPAAKSEKKISKAATGVAEKPILDPIGDVSDGEAQASIPEREPMASTPAMDAYLADSSNEAESEEDQEDLEDEEAPEDTEEQERTPRPPAKLERLQKILSQAGVASRRHAEELIEAGRVMVNGKVITKLGEKADANRDHIRVDGKMLQGAERHRYFVLNKPKGYVTTVSDPEGRATVMEFFANMGERLYPVGRLDYQSEGLLLMTNDGALANLLTKAASGVEKTYLVKVSGQPTESELEILRGGVAIERGKPGSPKVRTAPAAVRQVRQGDNPWFEVVLIEGRNRELRKMFSAIGHFVEKIRRVGYGPLILDQEPGKFRELDAEELTALKLTAEGKLKPKRTKTLIISEEIKPSSDGYERRSPRENRSEGRNFERNDNRRSGPPTQRSFGSKPPYGKSSFAGSQGDRRPPFNRAQAGAASAPFNRSARPHFNRPARTAPSPSFDRPASPQVDRPAGAGGFDKPRFDRPKFDKAAYGRPGSDRPNFDRPGSFRPRPDGGAGRPSFRPRPEGAGRSFDRPFNSASGPRPPRPSASNFDRLASPGGAGGEGRSGFTPRPPFKPRPEGSGTGRPSFNRSGSGRPDSDRPGSFRPRPEGGGTGRPPFRPRPEGAGRSFERPSGPRPPRFDRPSGAGFERGSRPAFDRGPQKSFGSRPTGGFEKKPFDKAQGDNWEKRPASNWSKGPGTNFSKGPAKSWDKGPTGPATRPEGSRSTFHGGSTGRPPGQGRPSGTGGGRPSGGKPGGFLKSGYRPGGAKRAGSRPGAPKSSFKRPGAGGKKRG